MMADSYDSERLRGFDYGQMDGRTDRRTFAIQEFLLQLERTMECGLSIENKIISGFNLCNWSRLAPVFLIMTIVS